MPLRLQARCYAFSVWGVDILTIQPEKSYQSMVISPAALQNGATYTVYTGGTSTGKEVIGLYTGGAYSNSTQVGTFTIAGLLITVGTASRGFGPGRR